MGGGVDLDPELALEERLRTVCGHLNVLYAQLVELAGEALATGSWQGTGVKSLAHWLTWQTGISQRHAREIVRLAEALQRRAILFPDPPPDPPASRRYRTMHEARRAAGGCFTAESGNSYRHVAPKDLVDRV